MENKQSKRNEAIAALYLKLLAHAETLAVEIINRSSGARTPLAESDIYRP